MHKLVINSTILFLLKTNFTKNLRKMFLIQGFCNEIVYFVTKPILILNDHVTFSVLDRLWYPLYAGQSIELDMQFRGYINLYLDFSAIFYSLIKTVRFELQTISYMSIRILGLVLKDIKQPTALNEFKAKNKIWKF